MKSSEVITNSNDGEVRVVGDFVLLTITSKLDLVAVEAMTSSVDAALQARGLLRVCVDRRGGAGRTDEARELLRAWIEGCVYHDRVAVLVDAERPELADDPHVRVFEEPEAAVEWLRMGPSPVREAV